MSTAKEMFRELGYEKYTLKTSIGYLYRPESKVEDAEIIFYLKQIIFYLDTNIVILDGLDDSEVSVKVLRAIDKQIEELGWIKSAEVNE